MKTASLQASSKRDSYPALVRKLPLRPLKTAHTYQVALEMAKALLLREERSLDAGEADYLDVLSTLIEQYEDLHHPIPDASGLDALKHLMQEHELSISDLGSIIGHQPTASEIVNARREMSKAVIGKLSEHFGVSPSVFFDVRIKRIAS